MRIHLQTLGCRLNEAELESWAREFQAGGHRLVDEAVDADVVVLNSCAVTAEAVRKSRQTIRRAQRHNPRARLVLSGCYATLHRDEAAALGVDLVIGNADKSRLVEIAGRELDLVAMPEFSTEPGEAALFALGRQRAFVKVQDGCRYRCTFCIVTVARGEERSRPPAEIVREIRRLQEEGVQEVVLTGVHLGGYGSDLGIPLDALIRSILQETDIPRLRLGSLEPWDLPQGFFELFDNPRFMPHLHLPLQSGSDAVLKRMARRCKSAEFAHLVADARRQVPDINITTDIIVGFPGETEREWEESLRFIETLAFGDIHIFTYSLREGTKAAAMDGQVAAEVKKERSRALHALARAEKRATFDRFTGREMPVLWENRRDGVDRGYTPNYLRVAAQAPETELANRILQARLAKVDVSGEFLWCEPPSPLPAVPADTRSRR
ncbi:tRNA (N(6)-L-threonylcarbamoyladenosine(37)-C(2))-methylthiotransferase MtaB [Methylococcus geothermalis]|uniref:tRNA (N(6)-L-threonylcarbamoyladenosine(37)-C(2))-methylthiotransferase MtaB n=1 Tax=Methylococcus geothermalis TaxID=2681310 RepID=A0A858Q9K1_9GAMM|nr:tRNA (N(6)-L-threonylcarbamoyladenosine(37)-C(2))-methylthiotransferase MtaB [Methylococcus geothermalis]QJD30366.1 tRNA (N(6)-L-threonylcarbamoyladenosine(37)-C(2))-methylthiotransferase MtaB [Methylococcus geothermalis]